MTATGNLPPLLPSTSAQLLGDCLGLNPLELIQVEPIIDRHRRLRCWRQTRRPFLSSDGRSPRARRGNYYFSEAIFV